MNLIINYTPNGMIPTKDITPHVPVSITEIIEDVHQAFEQGISLVHLHAKDEISGEPTHKMEVYGKIIEGIRKFSKELIICVSLSGRNVKDFNHRKSPLQLEGNLKPDMGSLTLSSLNFREAESINSPDVIQKLALEMRTKGILPELEAFDVGMINYAKYLEKKGLIQAPYYFNLLFGNIASAQSNLNHAGMMINDLPDNSLWSLAGIGNAQLMMNAIAIAAGGGVRIGLEDNIYYDLKRKRLAKNCELLQRVHRMAVENERKMMSPIELRKILNLNPGDGNYGRNYIQE